MPRTVALAMALALVAASLGACSGKHRSDATGSPKAPDASDAGRLTKAQYIAQGDAVCKEINEVPDTITKPADEKDNVAVAAYFQQSLDATRPRVEQFRTLEPPKADQAVADQMNAAFGELLATTGDIVAALRQKNADAVKSADETLKTLGEKLARTAKDYGFTVCGT
jgi:hypothetical protein